MKKIVSIFHLRLWLWPIGFLCALCDGQARAETPGILKIFRPSTAAETVSDEDLRLNAEHGPWLILTASFEGTETQAKAVKLARELRDKHHFSAYVLPKQFDYTQTVLGSGFQEDGRQKRMRFIDDRKVERFAVLVGDFDSLEDPKLKETLATIKKMQSQAPMGDSEKEPVFVTRNPLLPDDYFQAPVVDKFVQELNKNADYSLLEAQGRFTVRVATFRGADMVVVGNSRAAENASENGAGVALKKAAFQANLAAKAFRQAGIEAYEFHDRMISIVTIGSFDSLGSEDAQHRFAYASDIQQTMREYGGFKGYRQTQYGPAPVAKTLLDVVNYRKIPDLLVGSESEKLRKVKQYSIPLDIEPKPIAIPRAGTTKLYMGSLLGRK